MAEVFVISDTHYDHANILKFKHNDFPLRPYTSLTEMHVDMIDKWNSVVNPGDKVYHLGDVAFSKKGLALLGMLNGKKRLVRGNHDLFKVRAYLEYFSEIYGVRHINGAWLTHIPKHLDCVQAERVKVNIHGHLHANKINHPKYFNASVECIDYTPVSLDTIMEGR
jgi:calcineurin-like phosphoesterase family protein|tara:strand:- start:67 stop:564 length:498 start_codon:yes stop_codon:yes gene_type:complete